MLKIKCIYTEYLNFANESIDFIMVGQNMQYLYNYQGISYKLFDDFLNLNRFLKGEIVPFLAFEKDEDVDLYLAKIGTWE